MNEEHFYADVDLPFHVWVREKNRWVLREALHLRKRAAEQPAASARDLPPSSPAP